ncbi:MAG: twin-arginine translocation signal domain-containing protein [Pirellulales bacterium]|nr:twin-arginine translocation signal domain-containing protein [Pirellulales bacterium]
MAGSFSRRNFVQRAAAGGALAGLGDFGFLSKLKPLAAAETKLPAGSVQFRPEIEPVVRLLEETPRESLLEEVGARIRHGLDYRDLLAALLLAGIRNVEPRPSVGFKFHAVLVVNSAHVASMSSPADHRWLPIFWAIDHFKAAQHEEQERKSPPYTMPAVDESKLPTAGKARKAFIAAMDAWDEAPADAAAAALARTAGTAGAFELLFRYGCRDFRSIGHKAIYTSNSWRTLACIGPEHAEPIVRSLAYAMLNREGDRPNDDAPADRPIKLNRELAAMFPADWRDGKLDDAATAEMLDALRTGSDEDACKLVAELLGRGIAPQSVWDALFVGAGELLMRQPGIVALHAVTSTNALHFAFETAADDETRRLLLLQNAAFLPLFRAAMTRRGKIADGRLDQLEANPADSAADAPQVIESIFSDVGGDSAMAARKVLGFLEAGGDPQQFIDAARLLVFLKGTNAHDYKFSSAILEDFYRVSPNWRNRYLASSVFNLRGSKSRDNALVQRTRTALKA